MTPPISGQRVTERAYTGRFAPSPTGPLHEGSLATALASRLDAQAHHGQWLVRIEDIDPPREQPGARRSILETLTTLGLTSDAPITQQSGRTAAYEHALEQLVRAGHAYPCVCTRSDIEQALERQGRSRSRHGERVYPGTCRAGIVLAGRPCAWRIRVPPTGHSIAWTERSGQVFSQDLALEVGDFVIRRADGLWSYQLAVVVDDAWQGVTDVVRGEDLRSSTARQIWLQRLLGVPTTRYLHLPLVVDPTGQKLSKQNGAPAVATRHPLETLLQAARHLGLDALTHHRPRDTTEFWSRAVEAWRDSSWFDRLKP